MFNIDHRRLTQLAFVLVAYFYQSLPKPESLAQKWYPNIHLNEQQETPSPY
jgi:hypothetical protein